MRRVYKYGLTMGRTDLLINGREGLLPEPIVQDDDDDAG